MKSSKGEGTVAAAEQLGSMSLGETAVERKDDDTEPNAENGTTLTKSCSAGGKKSDTVKKCNGCKCVWYCDKECQNKHRREHKKECRRIKKELDKRGGRLDLGTEEDVGPLGKLPPREECQICMRVLPNYESLHAYANCCGKTICGGCMLQHQKKTEEMNARKNAERARREQPPVPRTCAFCREPIPESDEELLAGARKRAERKDPDAMRNMSECYRVGHYGLPVDQTKCIDFLRQSAALGCLAAQYQLGIFHENGAMGLEQDRKEALKYYTNAAEGGHVFSRHNVGSYEDKKRNYVAAMRHWRLSASGGMRASMGALISCFKQGILHHTDLSETVQSFYRARAEIWTKDRVEHIAYLKRIGEYKAEYES